MGKPITDAIDNLEASIDEGGNWKTFERALELVCSQRVQNFWKAETSKHSTTKRKPTSHTLSVLAWLWTAPEPDKEHQTERAPPFPRPSSSNLSAHRRPLFGTSLVYVYDGGVIPHRWLISTIPTTAVTPHNNSDTPWGDKGELDNARACPALAVRKPRRLRTAVVVSFVARRGRSSRTSSHGARPPGARPCPPA